MKRSIFLIAFVLTFAQGLHAQQTITDSISSGGIMRRYLLYLPKNYVQGSSLPLIIHLHGYASNAALEQSYTNYMPIADNAGFLVVYPQGLMDANQKQYWNAGIPVLPTTPDDVAFISDLVDELHIRYSINRSKVYASGLSNGGYMCYQLAWKLSNKIAAIASVSGSMAPLEFAKCKPVNEVPVMEIHGTADDVIPYTTSPGSTDIDTLLNFWVLANHCIPLPGITNMPDVNPFDGTTVIHYEWSAELKNTTCQLYKIIGGAHVNWPGAGFGNNGDFNASAAIWNFFNKYQLPLSAVKEKEIPAASVLFYPNPCNDIIHITNIYQGTATIIDMTGRKILTSIEDNINVSGLPSGMYFLHLDNGKNRVMKKVLKF